MTNNNKNTQWLEDMRGGGRRRPHLVLQVVSQVNVLRRVGVVQQLSVTGIHQVDAEVQRLLRQALRDHVRKLRLLQDKTNGLITV